MTTQDAEAIIAIAALAAIADGVQSESERTSVMRTALRLGLPDAGARATDGESVATLAARLSGDEARRAAYEAAAAVCHADGEPNASESAFLSQLAEALGVTGIAGSLTASLSAATASTERGGAPTSDLDALILDQAMLAGACELLPDRLASLAILPLQLRLVYTIGQRHGQKLDMAQAKDLAAVVGIGAAAQMMERVVRRTLGGLAGGILGNLLGGAAGIAAGTAVTFAATYALGHAAEQYYAQGRRLSSADLQSLFARFQREAGGVYPRVEQRIRELSTGSSLESMLRGVR